MVGLAPVVGCRLVDQGSQTCPRRALLPSKTLIECALSPAQVAQKRNLLNAARNVRYWCEAKVSSCGKSAEIAKSDNRLSRLTNDVMLGKPG
jgi:hypothetical protein